MVRCFSRIISYSTALICKQEMKYMCKIGTHIGMRWVYFILLKIKSLNIMIGKAGLNAMNNK